MWSRFIRDHFVPIYNQRRFGVCQQALKNKLLALTNNNLTKNTTSVVVIGWPRKSTILDEKRTSMEWTMYFRLFTFHFFIWLVFCTKSKNNAEVTVDTNHSSFSGTIRFKNTKAVILCICTYSKITHTWHRRFWGYNLSSQLFYFSRIFLN